MAKELPLSFGDLVCGKSVEASAAATTLAHLQTSIARFAGKSVQFLQQPYDEAAETYGAFCGRVTLENSCAALVGRIDPFRMLYLAEFQSQESFEYGKPAKSGFRWASDVLSEERPGNVLWATDTVTRMRNVVQQAIWM